MSIPGTLAQHVTRSSPIILWSFTLTKNDSGETFTRMVKSTAFVKRCRRRLLSGCLVGDLVNIKGSGWCRVVDLLTYGEPDGPQKLRLSRRQEPVAPVDLSLFDHIGDSDDMAYCVESVPPAQVQHQDIFYLGEPGRRFYATIQTIKYHSDKWHDVKVS